MTIEKEVCPNCKTTVRMQRVTNDNTIIGTLAIAGLLLLACVGVYHLYDRTIAAHGLEEDLLRWIAGGFLALVCYAFCVAAVVFFRHLED